MAVRLHRCSNAWLKISGHPCWRVQKALDDAGVDYEVVPGPFRRGKRDRVRALSGQEKYPVLELEDGSVYRAESGVMAETIRSGGLFEKRTAAAGVETPEAGQEEPMAQEPEKEARPPSLAEGTDPDIPQDPGVPGDKAPEEQAAAEADDTLPPGSEPPDRRDPA